MKKFSLIIIAVLLAGCQTTVPVKMTFPEVPPEMLKPADKLKDLPEGKKDLSDILQNANENYGKYYQLKDKYDAWIEWYNTNKKIYDDIK
jgi:hypothetical protein